MRKFTLFLMSLFLSVGAMAQKWTFEGIDIASNADEMLYTNAPCTNTQWGDQFTSWEVLFDNDPATFFHTEYGQNGKSEDGLDHYIRVDLGAGNEISAFKFDYTTRGGNAGADFPQKFIIAGSNDVDGTYTEIGRIESGCPIGAARSYSSDVFTSETPYRYLRFMVTETNTDRKGEGVEHNYWHIGEFKLYKAIKQPGIIDDFFEATTTFNTYSGTISNIINGNTSDKWWSNGAQDVDKTITVVLNDVHKVGTIKWYFCDGDKPHGAAIERRAAADGEWIKVADFTIDDIDNNIFTCTAVGADVKELRLRITTAHTNWLQVAEVELFDFIDKTDLQELIAEAEELYDQVVTTVKVKGDAIDIEGKISSNAAQNPVDGNTAGAEPDGAGIAGLTDTNPETYFHSRWSGAPVDADHYLQIDLGENGILSDFVFEYATRKTDNADRTSPAPTAIEVRVSADGSNFGEPIATFTKDADGLPTHTDLGRTPWKSGVLSVAENIRYIRLTVTDSQGPGNNVWNNHHFFAMGTLNLYSIKEGKVLNSIYDECIPNDLFKAYNNAINVAKAVNEDNAALPNDVQNATDELASQLNAIKAALNHKLNVTSAGWATLYLGFPVTIPTFEGADAGAYIVTGVKEGNWLNLEKVEGVLPANTGIIVKANEGKYVFNYSAEVTANVEDNLLRGSVEDKDIEGEAYVLGYAEGTTDVVFGKAKMYGTSWKNNANKAYLPMSATNGAAYYSFRFGEGTTGIEEVKTENGEVKAIFDLTGRKLKGENGNLKGIYIINGKKVLVK